MIITKYYCDVCGKEVRYITKVRFAADGEITYPVQYKEMCSECLNKLVKKYNLAGWNWEDEE